MKNRKTNPQKLKSNQTKERDDTVPNKNSHNINIYILCGFDIYFCAKTHSIVK